MGTLTFILAIVTVAVALAALAGGMLARRSGPGPRAIDRLLVPHLCSMPATPVLQVIARGDPNVVGRDAFGLLMRTYFQLRGVPRGGPAMPAPRARWPAIETTPRSHWTGIYAIPVPESVTELPRLAGTAKVHVDLTTWEYGEVAEILHLGPYTEETPAIERLNRFIAASGYERIGEHEEEYLKGPGLLGPGDPRRYLTLIRCRVRPATPADAQAPAATRSR